MAVKIEIEDGNSFPESYLTKPRSKHLIITGQGHSVEIGENVDISKFAIEIRGKNNKLVIGDNCRLGGQLVFKGKNQIVSIGDHTTFVDTYLLCDEGTGISIGKWCMFSRKIEVRSTDAHSVIDVATGNRINKPDKIVIGNHVWVSLSVMINKGVTIADDNVIAAGAFVNRSFSESQTVIAGIPAKVVKHGVTWNRGRADHFPEDKLWHWKE